MLGILKHYKFHIKIIAFTIFVLIVMFYRSSFEINREIHALLFNRHDLTIPPLPVKVTVDGIAEPNFFVSSDFYGNIEIVDMSTNQVLFEGSNKDWPVPTRSFRSTITSGDEIFFKNNIFFENLLIYFGDTFEEITGNNSGNPYVIAGPADNVKHAKLIYLLLE